MSKLTSRKFWLAAAAFLASLGTGIVGLANGSEAIAMVGGICTVLSTSIYCGAEAYVDGKSVASTQTTITASTTAKEVVQDALKKDA